MDAPAEGRPTILLRRMREGDDSAAHELLPLLYDEMRRLAAGRMEGPAGRSHTLQPTALVHEAWIRMVGAQDPRAETRGQFLALAAKVMRSVLVDHARAKHAQKRGGEGLRVALEEDVASTQGPDLDLLDLDLALEALESEDAELARIVELRFFAGLTSQEAADALGMPLRSLERGWQVAKVRLYDRLSGRPSA